MGIDRYLSPYKGPTPRTSMGFQMSRGFLFVLLVVRFDLLRVCELLVREATHLAVERNHGTTARGGRGGGCWRINLVIYLFAGQYSIAVAALDELREA